MKKIFITILLAALMPFAAGAQDARQRTAETIVADALAQLPAQTPKAFDSLMQELAATGADGIRMMAAMRTIQYSRRFFEDVLDRKSTRLNSSHT